MNFIEGEQREIWEARFVAEKNPKDAKLTMWLEKSPESETPTGFVVRIASDEILKEVQALAAAKGLALEDYLNILLRDRLRERELATISAKPAVPRQRPPKGPDAFATLQGVGLFPNNHWMNDYYSAQMQAGKD